MDSGTLGTNDSNSDLNVRERVRWGDNSKVYTRRNFRKKAQLESANNDSATTSTTAAAEPTSTAAAAASTAAAAASTAELSSAETLAAQNGICSQEQPQSRSEGEPSTSDVVRPLPEEGTSGQELLPSGGEDPISNGDREDQEVLPDVPEAVPSGGREEPSPSSGREALPEMQPTGGQEQVLPNGGEEEPPRCNGPEAEQEALPNTAREDPPEREQSEVAAPVDEVPEVTGSHGPVNGAASGALVNGFRKPVITRVDDRVRINITRSRSKDEMRKLKRKLESELDQVRTLVGKVEAKEHQLTAYSTSNVNTNSRYVGGSVGNFGGYNQPQLLRANSEVGTLGHQYSRPQLLRVNSEAGSGGYQETRPFRHLNVSVMENNHGAAEFVEKEKRTPKANQYYRNSEFLLGKDRLPPESNKKLKLTAKKHGGDSEYGYGFGFDRNRDKVFKSCSNLLQRLMKHKHAWVFNEPVDAKKLNIPDYHIIIKHPMDFGTIKTRLGQNWYKSAREFAEDVRLVFRNAMTYNPKGQDVHTMAEELSKIFEDRWIAIEKEHFPYQMYYDAGLPIPTPRKAPPPSFTHIPAPILAPFSIPPAPPMRTLDRSESMTVPVDSRLKPTYSNLPHTGRTPVPKKPKAKDPNKRDMTYEEKQKLSTNLQSLPSEKLDAIVQIIKKRNTTLSQHDDEIEVDIDSVDAETLWELDRFVTNYKKSLSKNKRKAELALKRRAEAAQAVPTTNPIPAVVEPQKESKGDEKNSSPVVEVEKQGDNASGSSSSSSSSSDSGSTSSDSDSDSSSAYGSDAGHSPKT
ncbi:unnamed protein product [Coffea canephora]|uniref:Bromo domain-containing protein n=1 Tax=Coffea canephora TaxID=49390 RepID=A0A068UCQ7_COFCA|nr:unnamed protein product [Coffea canephora]